jgi:hypothetical protein
MGHSPGQDDGDLLSEPMRAITILASAMALALAVTVLGATVFAQGRPEGEYVLIVHSTNPAVRLERKFLEDAFLKKVTRWPGGTVIRPVDLSPDSRVRQRFTGEILKRSIVAVKGYWHQRIFSGRDVPPPELASDEDAIRYVLKHEGAIAYVSLAANVNGTKIVTVK